MSYEFSPDDDAVLRDVAASARAIAWAGFALAALLAAGGLAGLVAPPAHLSPRLGPALGVATLAGAAPAAWSARKLLAASASVARVATSAGHDVPHIIDAVTQLREAFRALAGTLTVYAVVVAAVVTLLLPGSP